MIIHDNTVLLLQAIDDKMASHLEEIRDLIVPIAKKKAPVDTGALRDSIYGAITKNSLTIGSTVSYGDIMEVHQPHLRPALHGSKAEIRRILGT